MENVFLEKIIYQKNICRNGYFTVVEDSDPVIDGHWLMLPNSHFLSLAAAGIDNVVDFIDNILLSYLGDEEYMLAEKGCANL